MKHGQRIVAVVHAQPSFRFRVVRSECAAGPHQQRFCGVHGAADQLGAFTHAAVVHVAQCEHGAVLFGQLGQNALGHNPIQLAVPVVGRVDGFGQIGHRHGEPVGSPAVVVGEFVPSHADQPRHRYRRRRPPCARRPSPPETFPTSGLRLLRGRHSVGRNIRTPWAVPRRTAPAASAARHLALVRRSHPYRRLEAPYSDARTENFLSDAGPSGQRGQPGADRVERVAERLGQRHRLVGQPVLVGGQRHPQHRPGHGLRHQVGWLDPEPSRPRIRRPPRASPRTSSSNRPAARRSPG